MANLRPQPISALIHPSRLCFLIVLSNTPKKCFQMLRSLRGKEILQSSPNESWSRGCEHHKLDVKKRHRQERRWKCMWNLLPLNQLCTLKSGNPAPDRYYSFRIIFEVWDENAELRSANKIKYIAELIHICCGCYFMFITSLWKLIQVTRK